MNSALRVFNANTGAPLTPVLTLNEFYGFPPALVRPAGPFGPFTFDISCHYDLDTNRWFHLAVNLDQDPVTGDFTGKNYIDLAVSHTGDPTGTWTVYRIPGINDGTEGTPDHDCTSGPCFADFPHLGVNSSASTSRPTSSRSSRTASSARRCTRSRRRHWSRSGQHHGPPVQHRRRSGSPG